jgi:hypothetical protein
VTKQKPTTSEDVKRSYEERIAELGRDREGLDARDARLSRLRGLFFISTGGLVLYGLFRSSATVWVAAAASAVIFLTLVVLHALVSTRQFDQDRRLAWCKRALERVAGTYRAPADAAHLRGDEWVDPEHPYTGDLDVFGNASVFEQLNTTETPGGARLLSEWLRAPAPPDEVAARQAAARELAGLTALREEMALAGMRAGKIDRDAKKFLEWARAPADFARTGATVTFAALALVAVNLTLLAASSLYSTSLTRVWVGALAVGLVLLLVVRPRLEPVLAAVVVQASPLGTYRDLFALVEAQRFEDARLVALQEALLSPRGRSAAEEMRRLDRLVGYAAVRHNGIVHVIADVLLLWDVWCAFLIDRWRATSGPRVAGWLDALSELEALAAIATFAHEHPSYCWPRLVDDGPRFAVKELGHPLIPVGHRVVNDASLGNDLRALMISGSNMSGKSTMLRSMGVAAVLAQAGAPACARSLTMSSLHVYTSMRVGDALDRGASRFFMEVKKLKAVLDRLPEPGTVLFLLDEVLHGTNSRERNIGAKAIVAHLVTEGAIGAVSSHDLGLVELEQLTGGRVKNVHFEDHIEGGKMCFDYRMKNGPVSTSNALRLMRMIGIDVVPEEDVKPPS